jgi:hypothetical protein
MLDLEAIFSQVESISNDRVCPSFVDAMDRNLSKLKDGLNTGTLLDGFTLHWQPEEHSKWRCSNHHMRKRGDSRHMNWNWHVVDCSTEVQNSMCRETSTVNAEATTSVPTPRRKRNIAPMQVLKSSRTDAVVKKHRNERARNPSCLLFLL